MRDCSSFQAGKQEEAKDQLEDSAFSRVRQAHGDYLIKICEPTASSNAECSKDNKQ